MNLQTILKSIAGVALGLLTLQSQEAGVLTRTMTGASAGNSETRGVEKLNPSLRNKDSRENKGIEFRIGPVVNYANDVNIQSGARAQGFDLEKLDFRDPSYGARMDLDWEFAPRLHINNGLTWIQFDQQGTLDSDITFGTGMKLLRGSRVDAKMDIFKYQPKIGYDVYRGESLRIMPYFGAILGVANGEVKAVSGRVERERGRISQIDKEKVYDKTEFFATYVLGFETQYYFTRQFYAGADLGGYYIGVLGGFSGKGYLGYDFTEKLSLRIGTDIDWVKVDQRGIEADGYSNTMFAQFGVKF